MANSGLRLKSCVQAGSPEEIIFVSSPPLANFDWSANLDNWLEAVTRVLRMRVVRF